MKTEELCEEALRLAPRPKLRLIRDLVLSLEELPPEALEALWIEEVEQRLNDIKDGRVVLVPGDDVFSRLRSRLQ